MAHVKKYTMSAIGHMANHYGRSDVGQAAEYIIRGNENIDPNLTPLNYNLAAEDQQLPQVDFIHKRMSISIHALRVEGDSKNGQSFRLFLRKREKNLPL